MTENISGLILPGDRVTHGELGQPQLHITEFSDGTRVSEMEYRDFFKGDSGFVVSLPSGEVVKEPRPYRPYTDRIAALALAEVTASDKIPQWFIDAHRRG